MSLITNIIPEARFEIVRSRIAAILADEFTNLRQLNQTALDAENAKPTPDPAIISALVLNLNSLPLRVWEERFKRPEAAEMMEEPLVNVIFTTAPLDDNQTISTQIGDNSYMIEVYTGHNEPNEDNPTHEGDSLASIKLQRCLAQIRGIIMNPNYELLGFNEKPFFVGRRVANGIQIGQPDYGADNANNTIRGYMGLTVKVAEDVQQIEGVPLALNSSTLKLYDTDKGYFWTNESN